MSQYIKAIVLHQRKFEFQSVGFFSIHHLKFLSNYRPSCDLELLSNQMGIYTGECVVNSSKRQCGTLQLFINLIRDIPWNQLQFYINFFMFCLKAQMYLFDMGLVSWNLIYSWFIGVSLVVFWGGESWPFLFNWLEFSVWLTLLWQWDLVSKALLLKWGESWG